MVTRIYLTQGPLEYWHINAGAAYWRPRPGSSEEQLEPLAQFGLIDWGQDVSANADFSPTRVRYRDTLVKPGEGEMPIVAVKAMLAKVARTAATHMPMVIYSIDSSSRFKSFDIRKIVYPWRPLEFLRTDKSGAKKGELFLSHTLPARLVNRRFDPKHDRPCEPDPDRLPNSSGPDGEAPLVIVGIIDDGLPYAHRNFRGAPASGEPGSSRIDYIWLQAGEGKHRDTVACGSELLGSDIEALMQQHGNDEDAIYRDPTAGAVASDDDVGHNIMRTYTHGAHVMDRAAGFQPTDLLHEDRDRVRVIGVQLPRSSLRDTSGFAKDAFILAGIHYIVDRAQLVADAYLAKQSKRKIKLLINISLGTSGGLKDGTHLLERAMDEIAVKVNSDVDSNLNAEIVLPTGNSFAARMYGESPFPDEGGYLTIPWRLQPNDRTSSYLEIWMAGSSAVKLDEPRTAVDLTISSPCGSVYMGQWRKNKLDRSQMIYADLHQNTKFGQVIGQVSFDRKNNADWRITIILAPTEHEVRYDREEAPNAPAGRWQIRLKGKRQKEVEKLRLHCAVHRDEDPAGTANGGRQSYFDFSHPVGEFGLFGRDGKRDPRMAGQEADFVYSPVNEEGRFIADENHPFVKPFGSINGWATGESPSSKRTSVAGFTGRLAEIDGKPAYEIAEPALYSSAGRKQADGTPDPISQVTHSALSNRSANQPGVRGAGARSNSNTILIGTSAAAPAYVRVRVLEQLGVTLPPFDKSDTIRLGEATTYVRAKRADMHPYIGHEEPAA